MTDIKSKQETPKNNIKEPIVENKTKIENNKVDGIKEIKGPDGSCLFTDDYGNVFKQKVLIGGEVLELKSIDIESLMGVIKNFSYSHALYKLRDHKDKTINHIIVEDVLICLIGISFYQANEQTFSGKITYIDHNDDTNIKSAIILVDSVIKTETINVKNYLCIFDSNMKNNYSINTYGNCIVENGHFNGTDFVNLENVEVYNSDFEANSVKLKNLKCNYYYIEAFKTIEIESPHFFMKNKLRLQGNIGSVIINAEFFPFNKTEIDIYYGGKESIDIVIKHRIDSGFFSGVSPIPFVRTNKGIAVGKEQFTYSNFKNFYQDLLKKVNPQQEHSIPFYALTKPSTNLTQEENKVIFKQLSAILKGDQYPRIDKKEELDFDDQLMMKNIYVMLLAEQIYSRLKTFIELDAIGV